MSVEKIVQAMAWAGFDRLSDFTDNSCHAPEPPKSKMMRFYNPKTMEAMHVTVGELSDGECFSDDFRDEVEELFGE